jgi:RNA polymerase sigma-70 factor (ECF subfamily)
MVMLRNPDSDFIRLLRAARAQPGHTRGKLLQSYWPYLAAVAKKELWARGGIAVRASDVVQDTLWRAYERFCQFTGDNEGTLRGWLRTTLLHMVADHLARQRDRLAPLPTGSAMHPADPGETPSKATALKEDTRTVLAALQQLSEDHRKVIQLRVYEDCDWKTVGKALGRSAEAARQLYHRAIEQLRKILESNNAK